MNHTLALIIGFAMAPALTAQNCPGLSFLRAADVPLISGSYSQGVLSGLERLADGSLTLQKFTGSSTNFQQSTTPQYQGTFYSCIGLPPRNSSPPANWRFLADTLGISSMNPVLTDLNGTGLASGIGVAPYTLDTKKMQVWLATANKTPGAKAGYDIPLYPEGMISADVNNDGKRDVILVSNGADTPTGSQGTLSVFLGNGDGSLGARRDFSVGNYPQSAAVWDFNGDNKLDVVVANNSGGVILLGNGDGTFQSPTNLPGTAIFSRGVAVADVNKDGKGDVIIAHGDGVDIRLGNANGTFQTPASFLRGFNISFVATGDFNKDGNLDIAAASSLASAVVVLLGNGSGGFTTSSAYVTHYNASQMLVYDFDWDGNLDIVFGGGHPDALAPAGYEMSVVVLFGRGNGTFHGTPALALPSLGGITVGDFNGDGRPDVAATTSYSVSAGRANLVIGLNNGSGTLVQQTPINIQSQGNTVFLANITSADFNGDGRRDIAATDSANIYFIAGNGNGTFQSAVSFTGGVGLSRIAAADFNADSKQDLVYCDRNDGKVYVSLGNGNGTFQARSSVHTGTEPVEVSAVDVNADGKLDLVILYNGTFGNDNVPGGVTVLLGNGNGTFQAPVSFASGLHPSSVTVGDVNGDGKPDLIVSTSGPNFADLAGIHLGHGNGTFQTPAFQNVDFGPEQSTLADFNGDGKIDIMLGHCCGDVIMGALVGNGNGTFQPEAAVPGTGTGGSFVISVDMNQDGKPDVVYGNSNGSASYLAVLLNISGGVILNDCTYTLNRTSGTASALGDTLGVTVVASQSSCSWNAQSNDGWISFGGTLPRSGSGTLRITAAANAGAARSSSITIAGQTFTVAQAASGCGFTMDPTTLSAPGAAGSFNLNVTTQASCGWTPNASQTWITLTTNGSGATGSGAAGYNLAANASGNVRTASISVAGEFQQIVQSAASPAQQFDDVPTTHPFYNFVSVMKTRGITTGCTGSNYCPDNLTTRGQMAVFIIRALYGGDTFDFSSTPFFTDVPSTHVFFKWIQKMRDLGITTGCGANTYCPDDPVTRAQMSAFVVRARLGLAGGDPLAFPANGFFTDVPTGNGFFSFVQKMRQLAITSGCTSTTYCPDGNTTRGQMSVFIVRGLLTP